MHKLFCPPWYLYQMEIGARKEQPLLFGLFKAFDKIKSRQRSKSFPQKRPIVLHVCATYSELPSNISTILSSVKVLQTTKLL